MTFFAPDAPETEREVDYGDGDVELEIVSTLPTVNVGNSTAVALLKLLGLDFSDPSGGELPVEGLDAAIGLAMRVVNGDDVSHVEVRPGYKQGHMRAWPSEGGVGVIGRTAASYEFGVPEEKIRARMDELLGLLTQARKGGYRVVWS